MFDARANTLTQHKEENDNTLQHAAQRRIQVQVEWQRDAALGDRTEEKRDRRKQTGLKAGEQDNQDAEVAIAA